MSLEADLVVDRRRLKRRLNLWRIVAVVAVVAAVAFAVGRFDAVGVKPYVARLSVQGVIVDDPARDALLLEAAEDSDIRALLVRLNSPGGTVVGGEALYRGLRRVAEEKPVVVVMGELATSAAYMAALGGDHIIAREGTVTASIGVILQAADLTGLLEMIGIKPETVKSGPLKAQPNPFEPLSPEARRATEDVVKDLFQMFVGMVTERRPLNREATLKLADGRVLTGRQALSIGLVDALGGEPEARAWLEDTHGIAATTRTEDVVVKHPEDELLELLNRLFEKASILERVRLDGPISVWHPAL